jgi:hypothetical protein
MQMVAVMSGSGLMLHPGQVVRCLLVSRDCIRAQVLQNLRTPFW